VEGCSLVVLTPQLLLDLPGRRGNAVRVAAPTTQTFLLTTLERELTGCPSLPFLLESNQHAMQQ